MYLDYPHLLNYGAVVEIIISVCLGLVGFFLAIAIKRRPSLDGLWYTSLRYILTALAISAFSNAWSTLLLDKYSMEPAEVLLNVSMLMLLIWSWIFYRYQIVNRPGGDTFEKILKFLYREVAKSNRDVPKKRD